MRTTVDCGVLIDTGKIEIIEKFSCSVSKYFTTVIAFIAKCE